MGCVQAKPSTTSSPPRGLAETKLENGYKRTPPRRLPANARAPPPLPKARQVEKEEARARVEMVNGWPKWLVDNIPMEFLAGLVPRSADSYSKLEKVGQGTYSNVYKARDRESGKMVALKKVRLDSSESESIKFMAREIMILQKLDHPNVIKLEGLATSRMHCSLYLVFDFMPSDLSRVISRPQTRLTEPQVKCYMHQLLSGLKHCHERGILHRDIKGSNLLIDKQGMLKIADFGLANYFNPNEQRRLTSRVVTLWYRAPELLLGTTDYGVGIDLWSAGCLLAEMFVARPIMPGRTEVEQLHRIFKLCGSPPEDYWKKLKLSTSFRPPQPYKPIITETFSDLPSSSLGLLKILLSLDPSYRGSATSALQNEFFSTTPLACDLSGLPVVYKDEEDEYLQRRERRRRRSANPKQQSVQKDDSRNIQDIIKPKAGPYGFPKEKAGARARYSHELGINPTTGSASSGLHPPRHSLSTPPQSRSPFKSPSLREIAEAHTTDAHELGSSTPSVKPSTVIDQTTEAQTLTTKNIQNKQRFSMEKRYVSRSDFRKIDEKPIPSR